MRTDNRSKNKSKNKMPDKRRDTRGKIQEVRNSTLDLSLRVHDLDTRKEQKKGKALRPSPLLYLPYCLQPRRKQIQLFYSVARYVLIYCCEWSIPHADHCRVRAVAAQGSLLHTNRLLQYLLFIVSHTYRRNWLQYSKFYLTRLLQWLDFNANIAKDEKELRISQWMKLTGPVTYRPCGNRMGNSPLFSWIFGWM